MDHRHWAKSPSSETNPSSPRHFAQPLYSGFRDSEEFQRLPGSLRDIIAGSSASSARRSLHQQPHSLLHLGVPDFEDDTFAALPPPSFMGSVQSNSSITDIARAEVVGSGSEPLNMPTAPRQAPKRKTEATPSESPNKRARTEQISDKSIEEVDLAEEDTALADTLKKQRQQQVAAQEESRKPTKLSKLTCVICLDSPTDLTSTSCGASLSVY
ncbi:MAG: hypothetical protein M1821_000155 [Bathelium mastoideum]|nr:MAG: hypothetical protein M1821_000155 [Bathelium mastoideum]KAI9687812.1 MAG: hypothetical protein M1822_001892 [Bathelium mastoideum]